MRKLIFGQGRFKRRRGKAPNNKEQDDDESADDELGDLQSESDDLPSNEDPMQPSNYQLEHDDVTDEPDKKPGHGRHSHEVYEDAIHHHLSIDGLSPGDACPTKCGGILAPCASFVATEKNDL